jgi:hypothetical protein
MNIQSEDKISSVNLQTQVLITRGNTQAQVTSILAFVQRGTSTTILNMDFSSFANSGMSWNGETNPESPARQKKTQHNKKKQIKAQNFQYW